MSDLKPCPFCDSNAHIEKDDEFGDTVSCSNQSCFNKMILPVSDWNKRAQPTIAEFFADDDVKEMIEKTKCNVTIESLKKFMETNK